MSRQYFGTDGIRGTVGTYPITPDFALRLGNAVGRVLRAGRPDGERPVVLIGKDTRVSGYMLESSLEAGLNSAGVDVMLTGPLPTPGVAYLTRALRLDLGVVISASHNPFGDNGIKFFSAKGEKLPDAWEIQVEAELEREPVWVDSVALGRARRLQDASGRYIEFCKSTFSNELSLKGLKIVVDGAHGAAYQIAPDVFHELGAEVVRIGCEPDGYNINEGVGATHPRTLLAAVRAHSADYGIALDGDADRLQMVDSDGRIYNGDELLYVMVADRLAQGERVPGVVGTLMTNMAVELAIRGQGIEFIRAKVGDRYILEELSRRGWQLGGEGSGHLLALDRHTTGDGIVSALQVLQALQRSRRSLADMLEGVELFPQTLINVRLQPGQDWKANRALAEMQTVIAAELGDSGRILIRASGTEPLVPFGQVSAQAGRMAGDCVRWAARAALRGELAGLVTAPLHKEALAAAGEPYARYPGHTELLQALAAEHLGVAPAALPVRMMLANQELRTVLVSIHVPLRRAIELVTTGNILETLRITHQSVGAALQRAPRIAVAGLNPHAGEGGLFGREEVERIAPAIAEARAAGIDARGPFAPDTVFMRARGFAEFDVVVAMYHDQGLIPVKYLGVEQGVNVTLGLPLVRTSPDHGTAFDIAGSGRADAASLVAAVRMARQLAQ